MERLIESFILGTRWLLLPLYLALLLSVCGIYVMVGRELVHVVVILPEMTESEFILAVLAVLDLVLIANLLLMVGVSSYESYISRIEAEGLANKPEWLGKLDSGNVEVSDSIPLGSTNYNKGLAGNAEPLSWFG